MPAEIACGLQVAREQQVQLPKDNSPYHPH